MSDYQQLSSIIGALGDGVEGGYIHLYSQSTGKLLTTLDEVVIHILADDITANGPKRDTQFTNVNAKLGKKRVGVIVGEDNKKWLLTQGKSYTAVIRQLIAEAREHRR